MLMPDNTTIPMMSPSANGALQKKRIAKGMSVDAEMIEIISSDFLMSSDSAISKIRTPSIEMK